MTLALEITVRAALIAGGTAIVLWALRIKTPAVRHAAWTAVVVAMLMLPLWSLAGLKLAVAVLPATLDAPATAPSAVTTTPRVVDSPITVTTTPSSAVAPVESSRPIGWQSVLLAVYLSGVVVLLVRLGIGTTQAHRLRRNAVIEAGRATSTRCATPITVGLWSPSLILPASWPEWSEAQLRAVLTHENEHARRRDPLVQWLALFNRAVFWFHPLAWWLERRLATLAEEACDAAVLAAGNSPQDYSEYLLEMARQITHQGARVRIIRIVGMSMPGSGLKPRLRQILDGMPIPPVSRARVICAIAFCAISSVLFTAGTLARQAQEPAMDITFDVVSIKPCEGSGDPSARGGGAGTARSMISQGYSFQACQTLNQLIDMAWGGGSFPTNWLLNTIRVPPGSRPDIAKRVRGGPSWADEERFSVEIRMSGDTTDKTGSARHDVVANAMAPAMRKMLEDRFQLKLRKATEQVPMYAMTIAPGGLKIQQTAKPNEKCWVPLPASSRGAEPIAPPGSEGLPPCRYSFKQRNNGGNKVWDLSYISLNDFAKELSETVDRYVLNQTGLDGRYNLTLEYAPDERTPGDTFDPFARIRRERGAPAPPPGTGPSIFKAVELLGLKLDLTKGPAEFLQIDSVQRPKPDAPVEVSDAPARASGPFVASGSDQTQTAARTFDVVSIKLCDSVPRSLATKRGGLKTINNSENRLYLDCITLESLANLAYNLNGEFVLNEHIEREVRGGPEWVQSERFTIEATTRGNPTASVMMGPMLGVLLEDRFQLRIHRDTDEIPMYGLTVAKGGLKIQPIATGDCVTDDDDDTAAAALKAMGKPGQKPPCGAMRSTRRGSVRVWDFGGADLAYLADAIDADRKILDQTGIKGRFNIHLEYETDEKVLDGVNVFAALEQQLGLKLVSTKGPHQFIVIERVERPRPNRP